MNTKLQFIKVLIYSRWIIYAWACRNKYIRGTFIKSMKTQCEVIPGDSAANYTSPLWTINKIITAKLPRLFYQILKTISRRYEYGIRYYAEKNKYQKYSPFGYDLCRLPFAKKVVERNLFANAPVANKFRLWVSRWKLHFI